MKWTHLLTGRNISEKPGSPLRIAYLVFIYGIFPLALAHFVLIYQIGQVANRLLSSLTPIAEVKFNHPFYTWGGDIGIHDLRVIPGDGSDPVTASRVTIDSPGWLWTLDLLVPKSRKRFHHGLTARSRRAGVKDRVTDALSDEDDAPKGPIPYADRLGVRFEKLQLGFDPWLSDDLEFIGWISAAPFEAEGCKIDSSWVVDELKTMGLTFEGSTYHAQYWVEGENRVRTIEELFSPGMSLARFERVYRADRPQRFLYAYSGVEALSETYVFEDRGFIEARNRFCGQRDGGGEAKFARRHVAAVQRLLLSDGLVATRALEKAYETYATSGGRVVIDLDYPLGLSDEAYEKASTGELLALMDAGFTINGRRVPLRVRDVPPREIPEDFDGSTWDLVESERGRSGTLPSALRSADLVPVNPAVGPSSSAKSSSPTAVESRLASAPSTVSAPAAPQRPKAGREAISSYADLDAVIGRRIRIHTREGGRREGFLEAVDDKTADLLARRRGGSVTYHVPRESFGRAELIR